MAATFDFTTFRNAIVRRALRIVGVLQEGGEPSGDQNKTGVDALESLVKYLQTLGTQLWSVEDRTVAVVSGTSDYTLGTDILGVENVILRDASLYEYKLGLVDDHVFSTVSEPTKTGRPEMSKLEMRTAGVNTLKLWPVPDTSYTLYYKVVRKLADFDTALGTPEVPQHWFDPLVYSLAENLADEYQRPLEERAVLAQKAKRMRDYATRLDLESVDTMYLRPV